MFKKIYGLIFLFNLVYLTLSFAQETLTITTYYPSPTGSYNQLQTNTLGVGDNDNDGGLDSGDIPTTAGDVWIRGNVGIGTTNPTGRLGISDYDASNRAITVSDNSGYWLSQGTNWGIYWDTTNVGTFPNALQFRGGGTARHRFSLDTGNVVLAETGGNVGIGTTSPTQRLDVNGNIITRGNRTYLTGFDGANMHWIMNGTNEPGNNRIGLSGNSNIVTLRSWLDIDAPSGIGGNVLRLSSDGTSTNYIQSRHPVNDIARNLVIIGVQAATPRWIPRLMLAADVTQAYGTLELSGSRTNITGFDGAGKHWFRAGTNDSGAALAFQSGSNSVEVGNNLTVNGAIFCRHGPDPDHVVDVAEYINVRQQDNLEPGDIVMPDNNSNKRQVRRVEKAYDNRIIGVISSKETAAMVIGSDDNGKRKLIAIGGQVPTKVTTENGPIKPGDILVSSSKPGYAMKADPQKLSFGMIIGKALEPLEKGEGKIVVWVGAN